MLLLIFQCFMYAVKICEILETCIFLCVPHPNLNISSKQAIQHIISALICKITCKPLLVFGTSCWLMYESYSYSIQKWFDFSSRTSNGTMEVPGSQLQPLCKAEGSTQSEQQGLQTHSLVAMRAKLAGCGASSTASSCGQFYVPFLCLLPHRRDKQCEKGAKNTFYMNIVYCRKHVSAILQPWFLLQEVSHSRKFHFFLICIFQVCQTHMKRSLTD